MQALLRVSPEEMRRICRTHPFILMRDPTHLASFITHLSTHLQMPPVGSTTVKHDCYYGCSC